MSARLTKLEEVLVSDVVEGLDEFGMLFGQELREYILGCMEIGPKLNPKKLNIIENIILDRMEQIESRKELQEGNYKQCACCKNIKPGTEFTIDKTKKDGLNVYCRDCQSTKRAKRKSKKDNQVYKNNFEEVNTKRMRKILQIDIETNQIIGTWKNAYDIERKLGFNQQAIRACCLGRTKKSKGYKWRYIDTVN